MQEINKMKQQIQDHLDKVILPFWESLKDHGYRSERGQKGCQGMHFK